MYILFGLSALANRGRFVKSYLKGWRRWGVEVGTKRKIANVLLLGIGFTTVAMGIWSSLSR
jgi:hypothetical protein